MVLLRKLKVGECFQFNRYSAVFIRCKGGYRHAMGGALGKIDPLWKVIPFNPYSGVNK